MGIETDDRSGSLNGCPSLDELLPGSEGSGAEGVAAVHVAGCTRCAETLRARESIARALRGLPRESAPHGGALDFGLAMAAVNDPLDAELDRAEAHFRPLVGPLARSTMPAATVTATLAALRTPPRRLPRLAPVLRHVAALAAAAGVVAAALLARSGAPGSGPAVPVGSLDAQAALLTGGEPIGVEFVEADPGSASASSLRALGGGVPRLAPVPAARNPKSRGGP